MLEIGLACFEILLVALGLSLLYWWTNKEAEEANQNMQKSLLASENDYLDIMIEAAKATPSLSKNMMIR